MHSYLFFTPEPAAVVPPVKPSGAAAPKTESTKTEATKAEGPVVKPTPEGPVTGAREASPSSPQVPATPASPVIDSALWYVELLDPKNSPTDIEALVPSREAPYYPQEFSKREIFVPSRILPIDSRCRSKAEHFSTNTRGRDSIPPT